MIDLDKDGNPDLDIFNADIGFETTGTFSGQNGVFIADLVAGTASGPYFYTDRGSRFCQCNLYRAAERARDGVRIANDGLHSVLVLCSRVR